MSEFRAVRAMNEKAGTGSASEWLRIVWRVNELAKDAGEEEVFGRPKIGPWKSGYVVEEYPEARLIRPEEGINDDTVRIVPKTERANTLIQQAFENVKAEDAK